MRSALTQEEVIQISVRWVEWKGHYLSIMPSLKKAIGQYNRYCNNIKIGLTVNPDQRWQFHKLDGWREMVVIYETNSPNYAKEIEKQLINHGWEFHYNKSWNEKSGGGTLQHGHSKYYVYLLLD